MRLRKTESEGNEMNESIVEVWLDDHRAGRIALNKDRLAMFEYDTEWLRHG